MWLVVAGLILIAIIVVMKASSGGANGAPSSRSTPSSNGGKSYVLREGKSVQADDAFDAWTSADLEKMLRAVKKKTNKIDRHFLLQTIVTECYKQRKNPEMRATCREIADLHLSEFESIAPALKRDMGGTLPRVSTFQHLATVLTEDGEFDRAIEVCELAQRFDLHDGTKGGFEGRIERIARKRDKSAGGANRGR